MRFAVLALLLLAACTGADPPLGPVVRPVPRGTTETVRFNTLNMGQMRRGMEIGRYLWSIECGSPYGRVFWKSGMGFRRENTFRERFAEVFSDAGFDVAGAVYADGADRQRARYMITGELREVRLELCRRSHWLTGADRGISGVASVKIDWTVYDTADQQVVHRTGTTGHAVLNDGVPEGDVLLIEDGFSNAVEILAADPGFRKAVVRGGGAPDGKRWRMVPEHQRDPTPISAEPVRMVSTHGGAGDGLVRVGTGAGVVVGEVEGTALVLAPLAAGAVVPVRVGATVAEGTVIARDSVRGLMLARVPARLTAMRLRDTAAEVSEPVIAASVGDDFATGMVAGLNGGILADLEGAPPQPGDPLLDASGQLLGVASGGRLEAGLTPFVPIAEALAALGVTVPPKHVNLDGRGRPPT
ncbi:serine protease [Azospirillum sp. sgz301742]